MRPAATAGHRCRGAACNTVPTGLLLWLFWLTPLVGAGTVFSGMTVSVYALPSTVPSVLDTFVPFGIGLVEFMLFAVLAGPLNDQLSQRSIVVVWLGCLCLFGCLASIAIQRVRWLFSNTQQARMASGVGG